MKSAARWEKWDDGFDEKPRPVAKYRPVPADCTPWATLEKRYGVSGVDLLEVLDDYDAPDGLVHPVEKGIAKKAAKKFGWEYKGKLARSKVKRAMKTVREKGGYAVQGECLGYQYKDLPLRDGTTKTWAYYRRREFERVEEDRGGFTIYGFKPSPNAQAALAQPSKRGGSRKGHCDGNGGRRPGAGRPKGSKNKSTKAAPAPTRETTPEINQSGPPAFSSSFALALSIKEPERTQISILPPTAAAQTAQTAPTAAPSEVPPSSQQAPAPATPAPTAAPRKAFAGSRDGQFDSSMPPGIPASSVNETDSIPARSSEPPVIGYEPAIPAPTTTTPAASGVADPHAGPRTDFRGLLRAGELALAQAIVAIPSVDPEVLERDLHRRAVEGEIDAATHRFAVFVLHENIADGLRGVGRTWLWAQGIIEVSEESEQGSVHEGRG